jgi:hypothetical protein
MSNKDQQIAELTADRDRWRNKALQNVDDYLGNRAARARERGAKVWADEQGRTYVLYGQNDEPSVSHPSFGMVRLSRCSGSPGRMFGSQLRQHAGYVSMTVTRGSVQHDLHHDRYMNEEEVVQVSMTAAQFAELITTLNAGEGTPCTIERVLSRRVPPPPDDTQTTAEKIQDKFAGDQQAFVEQIGRKYEEIKRLFAEKKTLNQQDRKQVIDLLNTVMMELGANLPFRVLSFQEAAEQTVQHAKAEVDAMLSMVLHRAGLKALTDTPTMVKYFAAEPEGKK